MKLSLPLALAALLSVSTASRAELTMTFKVGTSTLTISDNDLDYDADPAVGTIAASAAIRLTDGGIRYQFASYFAQATYQPLGGLDGARYSLNSAVPSISNLGLTANTPTANNEAADDNINGLQVSVFTNYTGFTAIAGEPMRAQANTTLQMTATSVNNSANTSNVVYGAYYDPTNAANVSPAGIETYAGSESLFGHSSASNPVAAFSGFNSVPGGFTANTFSMGVFYGMTPTSTSGAVQNTFNFGGTTYLEQVPEPSHTALPVGLAAGLLVLRRRRLIR